MENIGFTRMEDGTREEYAFLESLEKQALKKLPDRLMSMLTCAEDALPGYRITRLEHSLQSATRAFRDGRDEDYVVMALLHDIGDGVAPMNHSAVAGAILRPYVSERLHWVVRHHGLFQMYYYAHHVGLDRDARDRYRDSPYFNDTVEFCEQYDQNCFNPDYENKPLAFFEPMLRNVLGREGFSEVRRGTV